MDFKLYIFKLVVSQVGQGVKNFWMWDRKYALNKDGKYDDLW